MGDVARCAAWSLADWITVVGLPLTLVGLGLGWYQLRKTQSATEATKAAVERTEQRLADNHLLILLPKLLLLRRDLDTAVDSNDRVEAIRQLSEWVGVAPEVEGILQARGRNRHEKLIALLSRSARMTGQAKDDVIERSKDLDEATRDVRKAITEICAQAGKIVGGMKAFVEEEAK